MSKYEDLQQQLSELIAKINSMDMRATVATAQVLNALADYLEIPQDKRIFATPTEGIKPKPGRTSMGAVEEQEDATWAGTLIFETAGTVKSRLGITIFTKFDGEVACFRATNSDQWFRVKTNNPTELRPFFDDVYKRATEFLVGAIAAGGPIPSRPIGFIWDSPKRDH
jgi:hypothetical protein